MEDVRNRDRTDMRRAIAGLQAAQQRLAATLEGRDQGDVPMQGNLPMQGDLPDADTDDEPFGFVRRPPPSPFQQGETVRPRCRGGLHW